MSSNKNLTISLIIPAHNEEKFIGICLESIKRWGAKFDEIIVVDNASTDRTCEVAEKFSDVRVVYEERKGMTRARQRGFDESKSDLIAYTDADTMMPAGWLEKALKIMRENPDVVCLSGPGRYYDIPKWQQFFESLYWTFLAIPVYYIVGYMVYGAHFVIRREVLVKMGGFDTNIEFYGEDTNIARRASKFGKVLFKRSFVIDASGRRVMKQGLIRMALQYVINFVAEAFFHKPITKKYKDYR